MNCEELSEAILINTGGLEATNEIREYMLTKLEDFLEADPERFIQDCLELALDPSNSQHLETYLTVICGELKHKQIFYTEDHVATVFSLLAEASQEIFSNQRIYDNIKNNLSESIGFLTSKFLITAPEETDAIEFLFSLTQTEGINPSYGQIALQNLIISGKSLYNISEDRLLDAIQIESDFNSVLRLFCAVASLMDNEYMHTLFEQIVENITTNNAADAFAILSTFAETSATFFAPHLDNFTETVQNLINEGDSKVKLHGVFMISTIVEKMYTMFLASEEVSIRVINIFMNIIKEVPEDIPLSLNLDDNSTYSVALDRFINSVGNKLLQVDSIRKEFLSNVLVSIEESVEDLTAYFTVLSQLGGSTVFSTSVKEDDPEFIDCLLSLFGSIPEILSNEETPLRLRFHTLYLISEFYKSTVRREEFNESMATLLLNAESDNSYGIEIQMAAIDSLRIIYKEIYASQELKGVTQEIFDQQIAFISECDNEDILLKLIELITNCVVKLDNNHIIENLEELTELVIGLIEIDSVPITIRAISFFAEMISSISQDNITEPVANALLSIYSLVLELQSSDSALSPNDSIIIEKSYKKLLDFLPKEMREEHTASMMEGILPSLTEDPPLTEVSIYESMSMSSVKQIPSNNPSVRILIEKERIINYQETADTARLLISKSPELCLENYLETFEEILIHHFNADVFIDDICVSLLSIEQKFMQVMNSDQFMEFLPTFLEHIVFLFNSNVSVPASVNLFNCMSSLVVDVLERLDRLFTPFEKKLKTAFFVAENQDKKDQKLFKDATIEWSNEQSQSFMETLIENIVPLLVKHIESYQEFVDQKAQFFDADEIIDQIEGPVQTLFVTIVTAIDRIKYISKPIFRELYESKIADFVEANKNSQNENIKENMHRIQFQYFLSVEDSDFHAEKIEYLQSLLSHENSILIDPTVNYLKELVEQNAQILTPEHVSLYINFIEDNLNNGPVLQEGYEDAEACLIYAFALLIIAFIDTAITEDDVDNFVNCIACVNDSECIKVCSYAIIILMQRFPKFPILMDNDNYFTLLLMVYNYYNALRKKSPNMYSILLAMYCRMLTGFPDIYEFIIEEATDPENFPLLNRSYIDKFNQVFAKSREYVKNALKNAK